MVGLFYKTFWQKAQAPPREKNKGSKKQKQIDFLLRSTSTKPYFVHLGQKNHFCLKWSKRVQMGPNRVPNGQKHLG